MQRFFDVFFSGLALIFLAPFLVPIAIVLKLTGEHEVFYLQDRVGKDGKLFRLFKFATMVKDSPNLGSGTVTMKNDPRVLPVGRFLRKTKINELPQLLNIFFGDMSIVGPRPQTPSCFSAFPERLQQKIVQVSPGLSGVGPIIFRDEENILDGHQGSREFYDSVIAPYKGEVEAWYVDNATLVNYFKVIFLTIWVVLFPSSTIAWRQFKGLPTPPAELVGPLNYRKQN